MQILEVRYYQGKGGVRQYGYWVWANLAVAAFAVGPAVVAGLGRTAAGSEPVAGGVPDGPAGRRRGRRDPRCHALRAVQVGGGAHLAAVHAVARAARGAAARPAPTPLAGRSAAWALMVGVLFRTTW
jgi:hypothetical protein